jgi:TetR/AcrR family transcriptional regulator, fatty acid metabolism regulator protein
MRLRQGCDRADADLLVLEEIEPLREASSREECREHATQLVLVGRVLARSELGPAEELAGSDEEVRLERGERQEAPVGGRVRRVAGEAAGEQTRERVAAEPVCDEVVRAVCHRDDEPRADSGVRPPDERGEDLRDRTQGSRREIGDLHRRRGRRGVLERTRPPEVVQVVPDPARVPSRDAEPGDRAVHDSRGNVVRPDPEAVGDPGAEPFEHDVRPRAQPAGERRVALEIADDGLLAAAERVVPGGGRSAHGVSLGRLDAHDPRPQPAEFAARKRARQVAGEVDDERPGKGLLRLVWHRAYSDRTLTDGSIVRQRSAGDRPGGSEEKRQRILGAAVRVFARRGYHTSRVGDIAEEAGVAHGLLYHYFGSKDEVLETVFRENWGQLLERFERVEASTEPADEKLLGLVKILLRTWRNDPDLVTVMVREVGRSPHLAAQVEDIGRGFEVIQRVIEQGQAEGVFREELDARLASWIVYGGLEEILTGWVMGRLPDGDEEVARAERTLVDVVRGGLVRTTLVA